MANTNHILTTQLTNNCSDEHTDVITLVDMTKMANNDNSATFMTEPRPIKKLYSKKPKNLRLNIPAASVGNEIDLLTNHLLKNRITNTTPVKHTATSKGVCTTPTTATTNSIFPHDENITNKKLNIGLKNVFYTVHTGLFRRNAKHILQGITGDFKAGELSAILGPSGAGKSTCLNILSGYTAFGYSGNVIVNDNVRDIKTFKPNVAFITQDTSLHPYLTVKEAMHFSANLKIGSHMDKCDKRERVKRILEAIGMYENRNTRTGQLSGGQKKRLAIALELVNNPPVLIMDEPTSGLDSSTSNQLILLLKKLALEGRTVICTIHQPSALTFEMFDHLYAIAEGSCIYSGGTENLVPFLADIGLPCPESYNPADYLMELATDDYGPQNGKMIAKIDNGRNENYRQTHASRRKQLEAMHKVEKMMAAGLVTPIMSSTFTPSQNFDNTSPTIRGSCLNNKLEETKRLPPIKEMSSDNLNDVPNGSISSHENVCCQKIESAKLCKRENIYATPFYRQLSILLLRTFLILWRDKSLTLMRFAIHLITAVLIGFLYYGIGNDANNVLNSFRYCFYSIMFIMYCSFSSILVKFPLEFPIVSREHFNRWYSLRAYYVAITLADIPIQLLCTTTYIVITYIFTDQPREIFRIVLFCVVIFLTALVGQSIGLACGASLNIKMAAILGPFFICPFLMFSGFFVQEQHTPDTLKWIFKISFLKYSLDSSVMAIFGFDRPRLECTAMYCHYSRPKIFLKDIDMLHANYITGVIFLLCLFLALRLISFYIMSFRLKLFR